MNGKINVGGSEKVTIDGVKVKEKMHLTSYTGDNPVIMGQVGMTLDPNTLIKNELQIINGVSDEGKYVWKKCINAVISAVQTNTGGNPMILQLSSSGIDLSSLTVEDFYGWSGIATGATTLNFKFNKSGFTYNDSGKYSTVEYDPKTAQLKIGESFGNTYIFQNYEMMMFDGFVVADAEDSYPDGAMLDGYWYELMEEGDGIETGTFTMSGLKNTVTISHSLDKTPEGFLIICEKDYDYDDTIFIVTYPSVRQSNGASDTAIGSNYNYMQTWVGDMTTIVNSSSISLTSTSYDFGYNRTYKYFIW